MMASKRDKKLTYAYKHIEHAYGKLDEARTAVGIARAYLGTMMRHDDADRLNEAMKNLTLVEKELDGNSADDLIEAMVGIEDEQTEERGEEV